MVLALFIVGLLAVQVQGAHRNEDHVRHLGMAQKPPAKAKADTEKAPEMAEAEQKPPAEAALQQSPSGFSSHCAGISAAYGHSSSEAYSNMQSYLEAGSNGLGLGGNVPASKFIKFTTELFAEACCKHDPIEPDYCLDDVVRQACSTCEAVSPDVQAKCESANGLAAEAGFNALSQYIDDALASNLGATDAPSKDFVLFGGNLFKGVCCQPSLCCDVGIRETCGGTASCRCNQMNHDGAQAA